MTHRILNAEPDNYSAQAQAILADIGTVENFSAHNPAFFLQRLAPFGEREVRSAAPPTAPA